VTCPQCDGSVHEIVANYGYCFAPEEIAAQWTDEERAQLPDVFDSVYFEFTCRTCGSRHGLGEFECA
jgi:hypothetical protein